MKTRMEQIGSARCVAVLGGVGRRGAFTLVETLVAVALIAVVAIAVASVFATVGDTVSRGQRVSNLNRFAARVERVMRNDFDTMIRDGGFLVIRNELTRFGDNQGDLGMQALDVRLSADDTSVGRPRRIDELMFFSRGRFESRRRPLAGENPVTSDVARVYYGHGQRAIEDLTGLDTPELTNDDSVYLRPRLDITNFNNSDIGLTNSRVALAAGRLGAPSNSFENPNEFASDWSLLRHVTLLSPPSLVTPEQPAFVFGIQTASGSTLNPFYANSRRQVQYQPAATSIFTPVSRMRDGRASESRAVRVLGIDPFDQPWNGVAGPSFLTGLVDVATTDIEQIRGQVVSPFQSGAVRQPDTGTLAGLDLSTYEQTHDTTGYALATNGVSSFVQANRQASKQWMVSALPSQPFARDPDVPAGTRVRYEPTPTRGLGLEPPEGTANQERVRFAYELADQEMLTSSVFLPQCTEFIVEWTYGIIDRRPTLAGGLRNPGFGQPLWHGLRRFVDRNNSPPGQYDPQTDLLLADEFGDAGQLNTQNPLEYDNQQLTQGNVNSLNQLTLQFDIPQELWSDVGLANGQIRVDEEIDDLIRVPVNNPLDPQSLTMANDAAHATYVFGYGALDQDVNGDTRLVEVPWPTAVRVTINFVDPAQPEIEQTYQAVFRVPPRGDL